MIGAHDQGDGFILERRAGGLMYCNAPGTPVGAAFDDLTVAPFSQDVLTCIMKRQFHI